MSFSKRINISISPLRLHSASSVQIPFSTRKVNTMLPSIKIRPLNILSAASVNLHGISNSNVYHNNLRIRLSPLKSPRGGWVVRRCWVNFQCRGVLLIWITVGQGPIALAVGAGGGCLDIFSFVCHFCFLSPSLWETARYRLKYCLKGPLSL